MCTASAFAAWCLAAAIPAVAVAGPTPDPCPTTVSLQSIISTPEDRRAACFGGRDLSVEGWGWTINNVWPGMTTPDTFVSVFALSPMADASEEVLFAVRPPAVVLPDKAGTPWELRDGIVPGDAWWQVRGHFADPASKQCVPHEGDLVDDRPYVLTIAQTRAMCANMFVISSLAWDRGHVNDTPTTPPDEPSTATPEPAASSTGSVPTPATSGPAPAPTATQAASPAGSAGGDLGGSALLVPAIGLGLAVAVVVAIRRKVQRGRPGPG